MDEIVKYFEKKLETKAINIENYQEFCFKFKKYSFKFKLKTRKNKIIDYSLMAINITPIENDHLNPDLTACLGHSSELPNNKEKLFEKLKDWLNNFSDIRDGTKQHDHGYRHGVPGLFEKYFQENFLVFEKDSINKISNKGWKSIISNSCLAADKTLEEKDKKTRIKKKMEEEFDEKNI